VSSRIGAIAGAAVYAFVLLSFAHPCSAQAVAGGSPLVIQIDIDGIIHPINAEFLKAGIARAKDVNAAAVLIRLDTPGGLADSMREMVESILSSEAPVITWVGPSGARAASAGFFLLLSADLALMAPGTNTGAAHPVSLTGGQIDATLEKKIVNDATASLRSYAVKRGRNANLAERAVTESQSFADKEALEGHLIDGTAKDIPDILRMFDGKELRRFNDQVEVLHLRDAVIEQFAMTERQRLLSWVLNPNVAVVLGIVGLLGLYVEITHPGLIIPGVVGGISLILALSAFNLLPINISGLLLLLLGIALLVMEATVTSHGILAIGGIVALTAGGVMLVEGPIPELRIHFSTMLALAIPLALITLFLTQLVIRSHRVTPSTGTFSLLGMTGVARTDIDRDGKVTIQGEIWNAWSRERILQGAAVRVVGADGLRLEVQPEGKDNI
jgi:membrane-bound serine protease (ClpP class)